MGKEFKWLSNEREPMVRAKRWTHVSLNHSEGEFRRGDHSSDPVEGNLGQLRNYIRRQGAGIEWLEKEVFFWEQMKRFGGTAQYWDYLLERFGSFKPMEAWCLRLPDGREEENFEDLLLELEIREEMRENEESSEEVESEEESPNLDSESITKKEDYE